MGIALQDQMIYRKRSLNFSNITAGGDNKGGSDNNGNNSNGNKGSAPHNSLGLTLAAADTQVMRAALGMGAAFLVYIL